MKNDYKTFLIRFFKKEQRHKLELISKSKGISLNKLINNILEEYLMKNELSSPAKKLTYFDKIYSFLYNKYIDRILFYIAFISIILFFSSIILLLFMFSLNRSLYLEMLSYIPFLYLFRAIFWITISIVLLVGCMAFIYSILQFEKSEKIVFKLFKFDYKIIDIEKYNILELKPNTIYKFWAKTRNKSDPLQLDSKIIIDSHEFLIPTNSSYMPLFSKYIMIY